MKREKAKPFENRMKQKLTKKYLNKKNFFGNTLFVKNRVRLKW